MQKLVNNNINYFAGDFMDALVIWLTGIPASGKSTIATLLKDNYKQKNLPVDILDGDELRKTLSSDLGFS